MQSPQTLHDFVLNLISDPSSLTAFAADPETMLNTAGLGGIDAADVHDVIPLVIDYAPTHVVDALQDAQGTLALGGLDAGQAGAIQQLQVLTQSLSSIGTSIPSADPVSAVTDVLHDGLAAMPNVTDLGNGNGLDLNSLGGVAGTVGHLSSVGDLGNVGDLGSIDHLASLGGIGGLGNIGNGDLGSVGNLGDLGNIGNVGNVGGLGVDHIGDLGNVGNLVNVGNLGNLVNVGNAVSVDNLGGGNSVSDLATHNPVANLLPGAVSSTVTSVTSHLTSTDALHSVTGGLQSDVTNSASHSPIGDGVSGSAISGVTDHVQGDLGSLTHNLLPTDDAHPLF